MSTLILETLINAPAETCFDLMRDIRLHTETTMQTGETAVAGFVEGLIGLGQSVSFEGTHFGVRERLTVKVIEFDRPRLFVDEMTEGRFRSFRHTHEFFDRAGATLMRDMVEWTLPFGIIGKAFDKLLMERHLRVLISKRNARLKRIAEAT